MATLDPKVGDLVRKIWGCNKGKVGIIIKEDWGFCEDGTDSTFHVLITEEGGIVLEWHEFDIEVLSESR